MHDSTKMPRVLVLSCFGSKEPQMQILRHTKCL